MKNIYILFMLTLLKANEIDSELVDNRVEETLNESIVRDGLGEFMIFLFLGAIVFLYMAYKKVNNENNEKKKEELLSLIKKGIQYFIFIVITGIFLYKTGGINVLQVINNLGS